MKRLSGKVWLFFVLSVLTVVAGALALRSESPGFADFWTNVFWLGLGIVLTTFAIETVIEHDQEVRQRERDAFAFRSFTAHQLGLLLEMCSGPPALAGELLEAAVRGGKAFPDTVEKAVGELARLSKVDADLYDQYGGDIANGLRGLASNYIRLFSPDPAGMVANYRKLHHVASRWRYRDALSRGYRNYIASLKPDDPDARVRQAETNAQLAQVFSLVLETGDCLLEITRRAQGR